MKVLLWHVHGAWTTAFVHGPFEVVVPVTPDRGPDGLGLPTTYSWPDDVREVPVAALRDEPVDAVILQRPVEAELFRRWTGRRAGADVPAVYVEHNTPMSAIADCRHPMAEQAAIPVVHVTRFNALMWDVGRARSIVIEHGIPDPGPRYTGELPRAAVVTNEPIRRGRITGTDLIPLMADAAPIDVFGMGTAGLGVPATPAGSASPSGRLRNEVVGHGDLPHAALLDEMARRRVYVHLCRWTSLGLALLEAMHLGMPVVGLATTEAPEGLAGSGALLTNDPERLADALRALVNDRDAAASAGRAARAFARERYSLPRFHADWERLLKEVGS